MEIDTEVSISINYDMWLKLLHKTNIALIQPNVILCSYSGNLIKAKRKFEHVSEYQSLILSISLWLWMDQGPVSFGMIYWVLLSSIGYNFLMGKN